MKRAVLWLLAVALSVAVTLLVCLPATWMSAVLERQTGGRLTLGDAQGTLWSGSAFIGGAAGAHDAVTPLLPGRFAWHLSPLALAGLVDLRLENGEALTGPVTLHGSWSSWQLSAGALRLPAEGLAGLGAPLNTLAPSGQMQLSWGPLQITRAGNMVDVDGKTTLTLTDMSSRLSALRPLGSYALVMDWRGQQAGLALASIKGPLLLDGTGGLEHGRLHFSGHAQAAEGYEETLASLLNLLGQRRMYNGKNIIALEFR